MKKLVVLTIGIVLGFVGYSDTCITWMDPSTGITWKYTVSNDNARIDSASPCANALIIPASLGSYPVPVTSVGVSAFEGCNELTSITIPSSVTSIGQRTFLGCSGLESVTIPSSVTSIGDRAFEGCSGLKSVTIPEGVTSIGYSAFMDCSGLTSLTIPSSVIRVGSELVVGCINLKSLIFQGSEIEVEYYGLNFESCVSLEICKLPSKLIFDDDYDGYACLDFAGCSALRDIVIPNNVKYANIAGCSNLVSVSFPESFIGFGCKGDDIRALTDCYKLERAIFNGKPPLGGHDTAGFLSLCLHADSIYYPAKYENEWKKILRNIGYGGICGVIGTEGTPIASGGDARYELSKTFKDRAITTVTVNGNTSIDNLVLTDGKVFDTVLRIVNTSSKEVSVSLPKGFEYETIKGTKPLAIPANSRNILTITRTADNVFLVSRRELEVVR